MIEEGGDPTRKEYGYRQLLINQADRVTQLSSNILLLRKKSGGVSKINMINFRHAVRSLAMLMKPYWDKDFIATTKPIKEKKDLNSQYEFFGEIMNLMKRTKLLLEKEITLNEDGTIFDEED